jgi:hypothetical protein
VRCGAVQRRSAQGSSAGSCSPTVEQIHSVGVETDVSLIPRAKGHLPSALHVFMTFLPHHAHAIPYRPCSPLPVILNTRLGSAYDSAWIFKCRVNESSPSLSFTSPSPSPSRQPSKPSLSTTERSTSHKCLPKDKKESEKSTGRHGIPTTGMDISSFAIS